MECVPDSITIDYETHGSGHPIVLVHGFGCDRRLMIGCMEPVFKDRPGWQRIYLDLPGMGRTKGADWIQSTDEFLALVEQFVDKVLPGQRFVLAGESYGGYLSRALLSKRPDQIDGMLLICPTAGIALHDAPPFNAIYKDKSALARLENEPGIDEFLGIQVVQDEYNWERFKAEIFSGLQAADQDFLDRIRRRYDLTWDAELLQEPYMKPVLILTGRQDHVVGYKNQWEYAQQYPRASFVMLDRAGHNLQIEQHGLFQALVSEWIDRVMECRAGG
ncbi:alpha/beta fold hydrolase [Fontibacillus sp. BL9]|uniref:alpha/beta fold hydrolase n=1 Tax=Fontibacillus sp. BL9 TaxID=3389971 RepID=UPI00397ADC10